MMCRWTVRSCIALTQRKGVVNITLALATAEQHFGVPSMVDPAVLSRPDPEEISTVTYFSCLRALVRCHARTCAMPVCSRSHRLSTSGDRPPLPLHL
jgi:hypothetical protein